VATINVEKQEEATELETLALVVAGLRLAIRDLERTIYGYTDPESVADGNQKPAMLTERLWQLIRQLEDFVQRLEKMNAALIRLKNYLG